MRYRLLALLCLAAVIAYIQRAAISVPLPRIATDLDVAPVTRMDQVLFAFYLGYAVMQLPSGYLADRLGSRLALAIFCTAWSILTLLTAMAPDYATLLVLWGLMGAAQAGIFPCATKAIGQTFPELQRAGASGALICGMQVGGAIAPLLTGVLLATMSYTSPWPETSSWRVVLAMYYVPGVLWVLAFLALIPQRVLPPGQPRAESARIDWRRIFQSKPMGLLCAQQFLRAAAMVLFLTWFPTYLQKARGVSELNSGVLTSCAMAGGVLGSLLGGLASDALLRWTGNRRLSRQGVAVGGTASCAVLMIVSYFINDTRLAVAAIGLGVFCANFGGVSSYTVAIEFGGRQVATVFSTMNMCGNVGAMLFPIVAARLVESSGSWDLTLFLFATIMGLAAGCWALLHPQGTLFGDDDAR